MKPHIGKKGYQRITLHKNKILSNHRVHRLVGQAFIPNPDNKPQINHLNGIKTCNEVSNLEWATVSENRQHAYDTGLQVANKPWLGKFGKDNHRSKIIEQRDLDGNLIKIWDSTADAERAGFNNSNISACCLGKRLKHKGFKWNYLLT
jgi:hypothetical protein